MDLKVVARLADEAAKESDLDRTITAARRGATPDQLPELKAIELQNRYRLAIGRREGTPDLEGRVQEALRVVEALYSKKNGKPTRASRTRQSLAKNGTVQALRRVIAKKDSPGLRILAENDRLDCAFERIALDFPDIFRGGDTLAIAAETLKRENAA
jgi:hypothetical protein